MMLLEIAFSIDWFLTVPGILITCGVILLIIALIMFISGTMKSKGTNTEVPKILEENNDNTAVETTEVESIPTVEFNATEVNSAEPTINDVEPVSTVVEEVPAVESSVTELDEVIPTFDTIMPEMEETKEETVNIEEPVVNDIPYIEPVNEVVEEVPTIEPIEEKVEIPVVDEVPTETIEPVVPEEHRPIYGGADPLEATQKLPKMDVHHEPYSGGLKETEVEEVPTIEPIEEKVEIPVVEEPTEVNAVEEEKAPEIVSIPDDIEEL